MADNLKKEIKIPVVADPKQADAQVDKFKKDSEKKRIDIPVNIDLNDVTNALNKISGLVEKMNKSFDKDFKFSGMQKGLDEVLKKLEKVTVYSKKGKPEEIQMFRVSVAGFNDLKNIAKDIKDNITALNDTQIDVSSFNKLGEILEHIESILTSISTGLNFEQIRPSTMVQKDIEKATKELESLAKQEEKIIELEKYLNKTGIDKGKKILSFGDSDDIVGLNKLINYMKEYVSLGGDLSKIQFKYKGLDDTTKQMYSLADVFEILQDENKIDLINDSQITNDVVVIKNLRNEISKLNDEFERAQIRENRDLNVSLDTKSVEEFSQAIATALEKIGEINFSIPEGFTFEGLSTENLDKIIVKLDEIVSSITNLATLLSTGVDFSKINKNIDDKFKENKHDIKIDVAPDVDVDDFISSVENIIKQSNKKVKIETIPVINDNQENSDDNQDNEFIDDEVIKEKLETIQGYFQTITNDFGDNLSDAISDFKESLEVTTGQIDYDTMFVSLRQSLLDIVTQFQNSLQSVGLSSTQLDEAYQMIKGWNDASNIIVKSGNKDAERAAFINRSNGKVSNGYAYDKNNEFSNQILDDLKRLEEGVSGKIGELYDTWIHSHPFEKTINGLKAIGSDVGFSSEDLSVYKNKLLNSGITNMMVTSNGKYANINWDGISEAIINEIIKEFKASDIFENGKFKGSLATENGIYNYDKQTELINNAIVKAMSNVGIKDAESRLTTGNIEDLKVDMSALKEEEQDAKIKAEELLNILSKISDALTSLDKSGAFKFEGMDSFMTQLENAKSLMTEICNSFNDLKQGFEKLGGKEAPKVKVEPIVDAIDFANQVTEQLKGVSVKINVESNTVQEESKGTNKFNQKVLYHYGLLNSYNGGKKSHQFGDEITSYIEGIRNGGRGWADGTGTYVTNDVTEFSKITNTEDFKKFFALDASKLKMYEAHIEEEAQKFYEFQHKLEQFVLALGSGYTGFDNNISGVTSESLYEEAKSVFAKYPEIFNRVFKNFENFDAFIDKMINLVSESGMNENGFEPKNAKKLMEFKKNNGIDDIKTRFLKELGFHGTDLSGTSYGGLQSGSVIFDIDDAPIIAKGKTIQEVLDAVGVKAEDTKYKVQEVVDIKTDSPIKDVSHGNNLLDTNIGVTGMSHEVEQAETLKRKLVEVTTSVDAKTNAFKEEEQVVASAVQREISELEELDKQLYLILQSLEKIQKFPITLDINLPEGFYNEDSKISGIMNELKQSLDGINLEALNNLSLMIQNLSVKDKVVTNMQKLSNAILNLKSNLNNLSLGGGQFLNDLKELTAQADSLKDIATIIKASKEEIKKVKEVVPEAKVNTSQDDSQYVDVLARAYADAEENLRRENEYIKERNKLIAEGKKQEQEFYKQQKNKTNIDDVIGKASVNLNELESLSSSSFFAKEFKKAETALEGFNAELRSNGDIKAYNEKVKKLISDLRTMQNVVKVIEPRNVDLAEKEIEGLAKAQNAKAEFIKGSKNTKGNITSLTYAWEDENEVLHKLKYSYDEITGKIAQVGNVTDKVKTKQRNFFDFWKQGWANLARYLSTFVGFYEIWAQIKQGITVIRDLDTALTEMRKVSDESVSSLKEFQKVSFDIAGTVGTTAKQIQNSTADWMRLGESLNEAQKSAKVANILLNVSEFSSIDEATESLVSMSAAYNELDKMDIIDKLNEVGKIKAQTYSNIWG